MGDLEHDTKNSASIDDITKSYVERMFNIESEFRDLKGEYEENKKDLKTEIKSREDETGVSAAEIVRLTKVRLNEAAEIEKQQEINSTMMLYEHLFGFSPAESDDADSNEDDEDEALG